MQMPIRLAIFCVVIAGCSMESDDTSEYDCDTEACEEKSDRLLAWEIRYNGSFELAERLDPDAVSGCVSVGALGGDVAYVESVAEERTRWLVMNPNEEAARAAGASDSVIGSMQLHKMSMEEWSTSFGLDLSEAASSQISATVALSARIPPNHFGISYRQAERLVRTAGIFIKDQQGESVEVGTVVMTDWRWNFEVAVGPNCDDLPSSLPL